jgi:uncharacterized protein
MTVIEPSPPNGTFFVEAPLHLDHPPRRRSIRAFRNLASGAARVDNPHLRIRTAQATSPGLSMTSVQALEDLRTSYGPPTALAAKKDMDRIDAHARAFIERSPFVVVSTAREDGWPEASPRGDAPGFVAIEGERRLLLPDRPGNNRLHSLGNVVEDGRIGLLFFVPGITHTLRVYGRATLVMDDAVRARFSVRGIPARSVLDIAVELAYFHCGKALIRSGLWDEARWPTTDGLASLGAILADQIPGVEVADAEARVADASPRASATVSTDACGRRAVLSPAGWAHTLRRFAEPGGLT